MAKKKSFAKALNEQISNEFAASQQYVAMAVYYDSETLPRLAAFFYRQALEEREHAMMMISTCSTSTKRSRFRTSSRSRPSTRTGSPRSRRRWPGGAGFQRIFRTFRARPRNQGTTGPSTSCSGSSRSRSRK